MNEQVVSKIEILALYCIFMAVGVAFDPPLFYTRYVNELSVMMFIFLSIGSFEDLLKAKEWVKFYS